MAWIKRNLFFVMGGLVAFGLLGAAGYYNYASWSRNGANQARLKEIYDTITSINSDSKLAPSKEKTESARAQEAQLQAWLDQARGYFDPIAAIPPASRNSPVPSEESFTAALGNTISTLQHEAVAANVILPADYAFSFKAESSLVQFAPGSLDLLAGQLGEVKTLSELLFAAGINEYDGIQRLHVSDDDNNGPQTDYIAVLPAANNLADITPYVVTFKSFGPEIARVFTGLAGSPHGFVVKSINIQPAGASGGMGGSPPPYAPGQTGGALPAGRGGLVTVLKEQLLRVTMEIDIIKLHSGN